MAAPCRLEDFSRFLDKYADADTDITLIKKEIKFSSYIRKFRGIGCKVIYD
jgi:hypothetical protein